MDNTTDNPVWTENTGFRWLHMKEVVMMATLQKGEITYIWHDGDLSFDYPMPNVGLLHDFGFGSALSMISVENTVGSMSLDGAKEWVEKNHHGVLEQLEPVFHYREQLIADYHAKYDKPEKDTTGGFFGWFRKK